MKTPIIAAIAAVIVIGGGIAIWQITKHNANDTVAGANKTQQNENVAKGSSATPAKSGDKNVAGTNPAAAGKKISFAQFVESAEGSYFCQVNHYYQNTSGKGNIYLSGDKIRGNFTTDFEGTKINTSIIVRDGYSYIWSGMTPTGYKVGTNAAKSGEASVQFDGKTYRWDADQVGDYECQNWTSVDATVFVPPTNIQFQDVK